MTTGLSYNGSVTGTNSYVAQIATMAVVEPADTNFLTILPQAITYAENRMYRDLDFLHTSVSLTFPLVAGSRNLSIGGIGGSDYPFVVSEQINIVTPSSVTDPNDPLATRNPCLSVTKEFIDQVYGSSAPANRGVPKYFVPFNDNLYYVAPTPDEAYTVEVVGTYRPNSLSATNLTTFISLYLPDLFIMASMIYVSAYQRNFSSASGNDPQMPVTYETQYQTLLKGATIEEARKKFESSGWSSQGPTPVATPSRG
jgi:hypothetical protein